MDELEKTIRALSNEDRIMLIRFLRNLKEENINENERKNEP